MTQRKDLEVARRSKAVRLRDMYYSGMSVEQAARKFGFSRQYAQQLLAEIGYEKRISKTKKQIVDRQKTRDQKSIDMYGFDYLTTKKLKNKGYIKAFSVQRNNAKARGIEFLLTFRQWFEIWETSGFIEKRGRKKYQYVMSRKNDSGSYSESNVFIQTVEENSRQATLKWIGKTKKYRGIYHLFPGSKKPYRANIGKKVIGFFSSHEEAVLAKKAFIEQKDSQSLTEHAFGTKISE